MHISLLKDRLPRACDPFLRLSIYHSAAALWANLPAFEFRLHITCRDCGVLHVFGTCMIAFEAHLIWKRYHFESRSREGSIVCIFLPF